MDKTYLTAQGLLEDSFKLAAKILADDFHPTLMIAVCAAGCRWGVAVQEFLEFHGIATDHIAIRTSSYSGIDNQQREVRVFGLNYLVKNVRHTDSLLIVDDVFDTGRSLEAIITELRCKARLKTPEDIRVTVPYYKPERNQVDFEPDYYLHKTSAWLKYPHSLEGLNPDEVRQQRPEIYDILREPL